jgi:hypothetical protein
MKTTAKYKYSNKEVRNYKGFVEIDGKPLCEKNSEISPTTLACLMDDGYRPVITSVFRELCSEIDTIMDKYNTVKMPVKVLQRWNALHAGGFGFLRERLIEHGYMMMPDETGMTADVLFDRFFGLK